GLAVRLARARDRLDTAARRLGTCTMSQMAARRRHLDASAKLLVSLSYHGVLARGFALLRDGDGNSIRSVAQAPVGARVQVEVHDGRFAAEVLESEGGRDTPSAARTASRPAARVAAETRKARDKAESSGSGGQGSLF
ncbi:MAG: exodeoxyribonuclease VII large subunit, partial [Hyphomicrobiales bacterium]